MNKYSYPKKPFFMVLLVGILAISTISADSIREKLLNEFRSFFGGGDPIPTEKNEVTSAKSTASPSPEKEENTMNTSFGIVYTQIIRVFHPLMLKFDYLHNGFIEGEQEHYALPGHYAGLPDLLKGRELSPENENSYRRSISLAATDLKKKSNREDESEKIQAEIADAIEKIRRERKLVMVLHENINGDNDPFDRQRRLITPNLPDLTIEVLRAIYQNYGMTGRESQDLLEQLESCQKQ